MVVPANKNNLRATLRVGSNDMFLMATLFTHTTSCGPYLGFNLPLAGCRLFGFEPTGKTGFGSI